MTRLEDRLLALGTEMLASARVATPRDDARTLLRQAAATTERPGRPPESAVSSGDLERAAVALFERRASREPLAYILGWQPFWGLELMIDSRVLVPTEERTGTLVQAALDVSSGSRVHEVGTGSGAVALAVKHQRPDLAVSASDISSGAVDVARENARRLGLDVTVFQADGLPPGDFDLVLANLPYTDRGQTTQTLPPEESRFQPGVALWAGEESLAAIRALIRQSPRGMLLALEHAPHHTEEMHTLLDDARTRRDARGEERVTTGRAP